MAKKKFLISIDTEGDNLWIYKNGDVICTENAKYLPRFQHLCEKYGFKPTYLTNYEMAASSIYQHFAHDVVERGAAEIGMHLHAWNSPPFFELKNKRKNPGQSYLIEYPKEAMEEKIAFMTVFLRENFAGEVTVHRAGRWGMDDRYFSLLKKYGYKVDCSVTPHIDWRSSVGESEGSKGSDYTKNREQPYFVYDGLLEIPVTVRRTHKLFFPVNHSARTCATTIYRLIKGRSVWLRPNGGNLQEMLWLVDDIARDDQSDYIMFMLHSSELMPGGSPTFRDSESVEILYKQLAKVFEYASQWFEGEMIGDYGNELMEKMRRG